MYYVNNGTKPKNTILIKNIDTIVFYDRDLADYGNFDTKIIGKLSCLWAFQGTSRSI